MRTSGRWGSDALAGVTLALLAVPQVLGYARIAGMPVVTGLYTMLLPMVANVSSWSATGWPRPSGRMPATTPRARCSPSSAHLRERGTGWLRCGGRTIRTNTTTRPPPRLADPPHVG